MEKPIETQLTSQLEAQLKPSVLEIKNESTQHGRPLSAESHFRVYVVSSAFDGLSRLERHRLVHTAAGDLLKNSIHALAVQAVTPAESSAPKIASPECAHKRS